MEHENSLETVRKARLSALCCPPHLAHVPSAPKCSSIYRAYSWLSAPLVAHCMDSARPPEVFLRRCANSVLRPSRYNCRSANGVRAAGLCRWHRISGQAVPHPHLQLCDVAQLMDQFFFDCALRREHPQGLWLTSQLSKTSCSSSVVECDPQNLLGLHTIVAPTQYTSVCLKMHFCNSFTMVPPSPANTFWEKCMEVRARNFTLKLRIKRAIQ